MTARSWQPPDQPIPLSIDLSMKVGVVGQDSVLSPLPTSVVEPFRWVKQPGVASVSFVDAPCWVRSFIFEKPQDSNDRHTLLLANQGSSATLETVGKKIGSATSGAPLSSATRLRPPRDIIKLQDRLHYLLQPSLESLLFHHDLHFPLTPFPFQLEGMAFLYPRRQAILADEMGLGKTMQAISAIRLLVYRDNVRRVLLVCPKPLVTNWKREFEFWAPELATNVIQGDRRCRSFKWSAKKTVVTIANYELIVQDQQRFSRHEVGYDLVVLDESQRIKNRESMTNRVVCTIARNRSWALTGTPVENGPEDLRGIFEFLAPGYLPDDITNRSLGRAISDLVLRRTKDDVLSDLPPRYYRDVSVDLMDDQRESYCRAEKDGLMWLENKGQELSIQHIFELVLRLKQICNFDPVTGISAKQERLTIDLDECVKSGQKAIVFSQWVDPLLRLKKVLSRFHPLEYHGRISPQRREKVVEDFRDNSQARILLMTYGAGGVGLNLQFASYVFLFDRWWNPAVEDQAIHRVHRIGSVQPVTVTRYLVAQTIEERIDEILREKRDIFSKIFSSKNSPKTLGLCRREIFDLFKLRFSREAKVA